MSTRTETEWLAIWECGARRHPIDRALLLATAARDDLDPAVLADLPLGTLNESLLRLRRAWFGGTIAAQAPCPACGAMLELVVEIDPLLNAARAAAEPDGGPLRPPTSRDLAAVAAEPDAARAAEALLRRCTSDSRAHDWPTERRAEIESALERLDPLASLELLVSCAACGRTSPLAFDVGELVWDEVSVQARALLGEVHALASAYGWSESAILEMGRERRAAYLERVVR